MGRSVIIDTVARYQADTGDGHCCGEGWAYAGEVSRCRGGDEDRKAEAGEAALPEVVVDPALLLAPEAIVIPLPFLPRGGRGSLFTAAAISLLDLVAGQG